MLSFKGVCLIILVGSAASAIINYTVSTEGGSETFPDLQCGDTLHIFSPNYPAEFTDALQMTINIDGVVGGHFEVTSSDFTVTPCTGDNQGIVLDVKPQFDPKLERCGTSFGEQVCTQDNANLMFQMNVPAETVKKFDIMVEVVCGTPCVAPTTTEPTTTEPTTTEPTTTEPTTTEPTTTEPTTTEPTTTEPTTTEPTTTEPTTTEPTTTQPTTTQPTTTQPTTTQPTTRQPTTAQPTTRLLTSTQRTTRPTVPTTKVLTSTRSPLTTRFTSTRASTKKGGFVVVIG